MSPRDQDQLYMQAQAEHGESMRRLVRGYESDADQQRDLLQEMHIELWRSLKGFDHRCSLRTWVYRVAHNVGADHLAKRRKVSERLVELEALSADPTARAGEAHERRREELADLHALIHRLAPLRPANHPSLPGGCNRRRDRGRHRPDARKHRHQDPSNQETTESQFLRSHS